jgi:hypothetical protein
MQALDLAQKASASAGDPAVKPLLAARAAEIEARLGESARFLSRVDAIRNGLLRIDPEVRAVGMVALASALALADRPEAALAELRHVRDPLLRMPGEMLILEALARLGRIDETLALVRSVDLPRYKVVAACRAAVKLAERGERGEASRLLLQAEKDAAAVDLPFARAYAQSRVALARKELGETEAALKLSIAIEDPQLRAQVQWELASDPSWSDRILPLAEESSLEIIDPFTRVWMFSDLARDRAARGRGEETKEHLNRAVEEARTIKDPWSKARALAVLTTLLIHLKGLGALP